MKRLLVGTRSVEEAIRADPQRISVVYASADRLREIEALARRAHVRCELKSNRELDLLARGHKHQGAVAISGDYTYAELDAILAQAARPPLLIALDQLTDPHNFGAIVRSAVAFAADGIVTLKDRAAPVTPVVVRASAGATERARIARVTNLARTLQQLKAQGFRVLGLEAQADVALEDLPFEPEGRVLVIGSEGSGLRRLTREACDARVAIAMPGGFESLNASVAAAIALYETARSRSQLQRSFGQA